MTRVARPSRRRSCGAGGRDAGGGAGYLLHVPGVAEAAGEDRGGERFEARLARQRGVERDQALGGVEQQWRCVAAAPAGERELRAQPLHPRALELVERGELRAREQRVGRFRSARLQLRLRGGERTHSSTRGIGSQLGRPLQEGGGRRNAAAALRPAGRALQLIRHPLVGPGRRLGTVPGASIGIGLLIGRLGQRSMHLLAVARVGGPVGRRADQWMPEPHPDTEFDQRGGLGRPPRVAPDPKPLGRAPQHAHVADRLGRRRQ